MRDPKNGVSVNGGTLATRRRRSTSRRRASTASSRMRATHWSGCSRPVPSTETKIASDPRTRTASGPSKQVARYARPDTLLGIHSPRAPHGPGCQSQLCAREPGRAVRPTSSTKWRGHGNALAQGSALQLKVQAQCVVHLRHDLRRYPTQDGSDAFDSHRTDLFGLSL